MNKHFLITLLCLAFFCYGCSDKPSQNSNQKTFKRQSHSPDDKKLVAEMYNEDRLRYLVYTGDDTHLYIIDSSNHTGEWREYLLKINKATMEKEFFPLQFLDDQRIEDVEVGGGTDEGVRVLKKLPGKNIVCMSFTKYEHYKRGWFYYYALFSLDKLEILHFSEGWFFTHSDKEKFFCSKGSEIFEVFIDDDEKITTVPIKSKLPKKDSVVYFEPIDDFYLLGVEKKAFYLLARLLFGAPYLRTARYYICRFDKNGVLKICGEADIEWE